MISIEDRMKLMEEHALERRSMEERFGERRKLQTSVLKDRMRKRKELGMRKLKKQQEEDKDSVRLKVDVTSCILLT